IEKALNTQVTSENYSAHYYLAMASWCETNALPGAAKFLYMHAEQERAHMMKLFHYINDTGGFAIVDHFKVPPQTSNPSSRFLNLSPKMKKKSRAKSIILSIYA